jgi:hypothetical protein
MGVNSQFKDDFGLFEFDYFNSMYSFRAYFSLEYPSSKLIEITDENYQVLLSEGKING